MEKNCQIHLRHECPSNFHFPSFHTNWKATTTYLEVLVGVYGVVYCTLQAANAMQGANVWRIDACWERKIKQQGEYRENTPVWGLFLTMC